MKQHFRMFAAYNRWANERIYEAAGALPEADWERDVSAFFTSMCGTLNHLLVTDRIWMRRFTGEGEAPDRLDAVLHTAYADLLAARRSEDRRITDWIESRDDAAFGGSFTYMTVTDRRTVTQALGPALAHLFNHQTHHRGQAHGILSQLGQAPPPLDLIYFQRERQEFAN